MKRIFLLLIILILFIFVPLNIAKAATSPDLGTAATFGILSSTFTRNIGLTTISGDVGYTTLSGSGTSTVTGSTFVPAPTQAGIDQATALSILNAQVCDFTFGSATDLSLLPQPLTPGVYCIIGAQSIGTGGITLNGGGTYVFRSTGALNTTAGSVVSLSGGASACNVFWTPVATTLGANTTFKGTVIDTAAITVGSTVAWEGRALAYGLTVTTNTDTITVPTCLTPTPTPTPTSTPAPTSSNPGSNGASSVTPTVYPDLTNILTPNVIESKRVDEDSIFISWGPYSGIDSFNIQYGLINGSWINSVDITGFSTTINNLPQNLPIWVRIAPRNAIAIGIYGDAKQVGGPVLPRAGNGPEDNINPILPGIISFFTAGVYLTLTSIVKKYYK